MTITKAIEIIELNIKEADPKMPADTLDALKLAAQALKWRFMKEAAALPDYYVLLPGQTNK